MSHVSRRMARTPWMVVIVLLTVFGILPQLAAPSAGAASHPYLRAEPWGGFPPGEPSGSYLSGINGYENEVDKFRFEIAVESDHQPVTIEWSGKAVSGNPASGALPSDALIGGALVGAQTTVTGGTTFEWNPGEDTGSLEVACGFPATNNTAIGNCFWITITATDSLDQSTSVDVYLRVIEDVNPPSVAVLNMTPADGTAAIGETVSFTVLGTDTDIPTARFMKYALLGGPEEGIPGASIDEDTGEFSWTPSVGQDGSYEIPIIVEEVDPLLPQGQLRSNFVQVPVVVGSGNRSPVVEVDTPVMNIVAGDIAETGFTYYDLDYPYQDLSVTLVGAPPGSAIDPSGNPDTFTWPTTAADDGKRFDFSLEVTDGVDTTSVPMTVIVGTVTTLQISVTETIGVTDTITVTSPVVISITETVGVSDQVAVRPPVLIQISESIGVTDAVVVRPPVVIRITEAVGVSDSIAVTPPLVIRITEAVGVSDSIVVTPPVVIRITESVGVLDSVVVTPAALGAISGMKWEDLNGDGTLDTGEPPIEGVTIYLDLNDDALPSPGEPSTLTAADGSYEFADLAPGEWVVREVVPGGYVQTFPAAAVEGEHRVTVTGADTVIDVDFGNSAETTPVPVIQPIADVVLDVGEFVEIGFVLEGNPDPSLYLHEWTGYPPTALINGVIPYTPLPEQAGMEYVVTLTVTAIDDPAVFDTETFSIRVNELNQPATIAPISDAFGVPGEDIVVELDIIDPEGDAYTKVWTGHPPNALINGIFILNPTSEQAGEAFPITLDIVQGGQIVATETFTVFVGEVPGDPAGAPGITLPPGGGIQVTGGGFEPETGIGIFLFSDPILLGTANADEFGTFSTVVQIPNGIDPGLHTIVVMGTAAGGGTRSLAGPIEISDDPDQDGLTTAEETLTGTDPSMADTDGDGLVDGIDPTWLRSYLSQLPSDAFKSRFARALLTYRVAWLQAAVSLGERHVALYLISSIERRADGCGSNPDRNDWIRDCETQAELGELLGLLKRNISVMELPDPPQWWE